MDTSYIFVFVYINDIIVIASSVSDITYFISMFHNHVPLKDLGTLYYFFEIEVS